MPNTAYQANPALLHCLVLLTIDHFTRRGGARNEVIQWSIELIYELQAPLAEIESICDGLTKNGKIDRQYLQEEWQITVKGANQLRRTMKSHPDWFKLPRLP